MQESIAVTQNFVSSIGLRQCLAFLKTGNPELVSGCLPGKRTNLHKQFLAALQMSMPEVSYPASPPSLLLHNLELGIVRFSCTCDQRSSYWNWWWHVYWHSIMDKHDIYAQVYQAASEEVCKVAKARGLSSIFSTHAEELHSMSALEQGDNCAHKKARTENDTGFCFRF